MRNRVSFHREVAHRLEIPANVHASGPTAGMIVAVGQHADAIAPDDEDLVVEVPHALPYDDFGAAFLSRVLNLRRVTESIDRILGPTFELGPIGAGPGRKFARLTASGQFLPSEGEPLAGTEVGYRVFIHVAVTFDIDLRLDSHRFHADIVVPLEVRLRLIEPLTIVWDLSTPDADQLEIQLVGDKRRATALQKLSGLDSEMRRFMLRFIDRELHKPHVQKARFIPIDKVIDEAWEQIACQFLPNSPEDRIDPGVKQ